MIGAGLCLLVGVSVGDTGAEIDIVADKISGMRLFADAGGKMNLSLLDVGGAVLVVSQFTLLGDIRRGRRPSFTSAAPPDVAEPLVASLVTGLRERGLNVEEGVFGATMEVSLVNDGPVTIVLDVSDGRIV